MHLVFNFIILFIFLYLMLYFGVPNIGNGHYVYHKVIIFLLIFIFQFILYIISDFNDRKYTIREIATKTVLTSLACVIGYAIFNDLIYAKSIKVSECDYRLICLNATFTMMIVVILTKVIELVINSNSF